MTAPSKPFGHEISVPWGNGESLKLKLPAHWPVPELAEPNRERPVSGYVAALEAALDAPVDSPRLEQLADRGAPVAVIVDDPSRWTPIASALPVILSRLHAAGIRDSDISICVGVGRHHVVDAPAMRHRLGPAVAGRYRCYSPPLDDEDQYDHMGNIGLDVPIRVFRPVARANLRVLVGSVLPHLQAGFGGGYKLIFPGCSHRSTLGALHRQGLDGDHSAVARLLGCDVRENPMRQAIRAAAALLEGAYFSVSHVLGGRDEVLALAAGEVEAVQQMLSSEAARRFRIDHAAPADVVIAGNSPWPGDPMMSFKVLLNHRAGASKGGVLVGLFWTREEELDRSLPMSALHAIARAGAPGAWLMRHALKGADHALSLVKHPSRFMIRWARELVVDQTVLVYSPQLRQALGHHLGPVQLFDNLAELWRGVEKPLGGRPQSLRVYPFGGLTYIATT